MRLLALAMLFAVGAAVPCLGAPGDPAKTFQITGVVVSTRDGSPVPYCRLTAFAIPGSEIGSAPAAPAVRGMAQGRQGGGRMGGPMRGAPPPQNPETRADASGHFALNVPRGGGWRLVGEARGFNQQNFDAQDGFFAAVVLSDSEPAYNLTFRMTPEALVTGLIYDESGDPVEQAQVMAELIPAPVPGESSVAVSERPRPVGFSQTDDRGHFEISGLAPGRYRLRVEARPWYSNGMGGMFARANPQGGAGAAPPPDPPLDFVYGTTWYPGTGDENAAETITLGPGEERQADMHLTAIPSVHLKIPQLDPPAEQGQQNGNQRGRVQQTQPPQVMRVSADGNGGFGGSTITITANGEWDFGGLSPGTYEVRLPGANGRPDGEVRQVTVTPGSQSVMTLDGAKPLVRVEVALDGVAEGENVGIEFVDTETGRRIQATMPQRGRRGSPFGGGLGAQDEDSDEAREPGSPLRFAMMPPHDYEVYVNGAGGLYLTGLSAKDAKVQGRTVTVEQAARVTVHVANGRGRVEGVARMDGKPIEGAMVLLVPATLGEPGNLAAVQRDETNTDGTFLISNVMPGRYILVAIDRGWTVDWRKPETLAPYLLHGVPVEVKAAAKLSEELEAVGR